MKKAKLNVHNIFENITGIFKCFKKTQFNPIHKTVNEIYIIDAKQIVVFWHWCQLLQNRKY